VAANALRDPFSLVGTVLQNEYRVDAVIGEGGFGVVYRGLHLGLEQPIAIKVLKGLELEDPRMQETLFAKFKDEAKLLYTLSQESLTIVRSMDFGALTTPSGAWAPFMVLEWLQGRSLAQDLDARRAQGMRGRSVEEALAILEPAAQGLAVAHKRRVAHRDIKPANFFLPDVAHGPRLKVLDFGIAKMMKEGEQAGTRGTFASFTWLYAAPEQLDPRLGQTGLQTDVYAFALVLTELLTDRPPVDARDVVSILKASTDPTVRPTPRSRGAQNVPDHIEVTCRRALAVDPAARFQSVPEFWDALTGGAGTKRPSTVAVPSMVASSQVVISSQPGSAPSAFASTAAAPSGHGAPRTGPPLGTPPPGTYPPITNAPTAPPMQMQMPMQMPMTGGPMQSWTGTGPPQMMHTHATQRRALPPRPAETSSIVPVAVVLIVISVFLAGSCAMCHALAS
jgi:eukaryotic-like serine/threonine-protein kinase